MTVTVPLRKLDLFLSGGIDLSYGFLLKQARKNLKLSLREAAARFRMSPSTLNRYEEGLISHIPPQKLDALLEGYGIDPEKIRMDWVRTNSYERLTGYEESQRRVDADFLYERYMSLDERGRRNVLSLLIHESEVTAGLRSSKPQDPRA